MALTYTPTVDQKAELPAFRLPSVDGKIYSNQEFKGVPALLVMFICNHCPYVQAVEDRLIELGHKMKAKGAQLIAICANDATEHPEDSLPELKKRWLEKKYPFPYLHDESQSTAHAFGAVCTPDFFLYDRQQRLVYRGRLDDSWKDPTKVQRHELETAMENCLRGQPVNPEQIPAMGCSIKWRES